MLRGNVKKFAAIGLAILLSFTVAGGLVSAAPLPTSELRWTGIITFERDINPIARAAIVRGAGGIVESDLDALNMAIINLPSQAVANGLARVKGVVGVEADSIKTFCEETLPWGVDRIDADLVWNENLISRGEGVNVAVLDTGIDTDHPDLAANIEGKYSCVNRVTSNVEDSHGHGTHCSGIIAGIDNEIGVVGVGPKIDLYMVQISRTGYIKETDIVEGINWCVATHTKDSDPNNDIQVMSMSFGGGYSLSEDLALQAAYDHGIVAVAAAGNESGDVIYPAALPTVIAVSAVDVNNEFAWFSNFGSDIELAAPGVDILSTYLNGSYATMSGTSMACPHVAGVAALVIASGTVVDTNSTTGIADEVRARLAATAEDIGLTDDQQGAGLVDALAAVGSITVPVTGSINGNVTDNLSQPIVGATISIDGTSLSESTDDNGYYQISGIPVGTYTVTAAATGYLSLPIDDVLVENDSTTTVNFALTPVTLPDRESMTVDSISFTTKKAGKNLFLNTTVKVVDEGTNPVSGAIVKMTLSDSSSSWNFTGTTLADGTVTFSLKTSTGTYTATIANDGVTHPNYTFDYVSSTLEASFTLT